MATTVHDPVHGSIPLSAGEVALIDGAAFRRLRFVKQLGLAEMAFPGATHSRWSHSLGAMHVASAMFDQVAPPLALADDHRRLLRQGLRLAVLFHDLGHPPLSHACESALPPRGDLCLGPFAGGPDDGRTAHHEDLAIHLLRSPPLADDLAAAVGPDGVRVELVCALLCGRRPEAVALPELTAGGVDLLPLLTAMVAGELDADRMDYLRRDATFTGVGTGHFDHGWLVGNLLPLRRGDAWHLGLGHRAIWALESFLLARQHMFLSVYHHRTVVALDTILAAVLAEQRWRWPAEPPQFVAQDDVVLWGRLRAAPGHWARRLVERRPLTLVAEAQMWEAAAPNRAGPLEAGHAAMAAAGIAGWLVRSESVLSRYARPGAEAVPLLVRAPEGAAVPVDQYTPLYRRTAQVAGTTRLFCLPEHAAAARACLPGRVRAPR